MWKRHESSFFSRPLFISCFPKANKVLISNMPKQYHNNGYRLIEILLQMITGRLHGRYHDTLNGNTPISFTTDIISPLSVCNSFFNAFLCITAIYAN